MRRSGLLQNGRIGRTRRERLPRRPGIQVPERRVLSARVHRFNLHAEPD
jgi:hypothetical protein